MAIHRLKRDIDSAAGFDPSAPFTLTEKIVRERGQILSERIAREFGVETKLPADLFVRVAAQEGPDWTESWQVRIPTLSGIGAMLALLEALVNIDSGSYDKPGVDAVGIRIAEFLAGHGIPVTTIPVTTIPD